MPLLPPSPRLHRMLAPGLSVVRTLAVTGLLWAAAARGAGAQADRIDAGSFSVLRDGMPVGREQFSLRKAPLPDGATFELRAELTQGDRRSAVQLTTDSTGTPIRYSVEIREDAAVSVRLGGQRVRGRFATQVRRPGGEGAREFLLQPGVIVLESEFFNQLAFVIRGRQVKAGETFVLPVLAPLEGVQQMLRVTLESGNDFVTIAGVRRPAHRWKLEDPAGVVRTVWGDAEGRVLRVLIPARQLEAVRDELPR